MSSVLIYDLVLFIERCVVHRDLHVLTHSSPPRRSSDLSRLPVAERFRACSAATGGDAGAVARPAAVRLGLPARRRDFPRREPPIYPLWHGLSGPRRPAALRTCGGFARRRPPARAEIGRASCRERVGRYV